MIIRKGEITDLCWLMEELQKFSKFFDTRKELFGDYEYALSAMGEMIKSHVVFIVCNEDGDRLGFIAGIVTLHIFNPGIKVLAETFWWVEEGSRNTRAGAMLFKEFISWGKKHVDWITLALESKSPVNENTLLKRGFKLHERSYLLEV